MIKVIDRHGTGTTVEADAFSIDNDGNLWILNGKQVRALYSAHTWSEAHATGDKPGFKPESFLPKAATDVERMVSQAKHL